MTAEIQPVDEPSGLRVRQLVAELRGTVTEAVPRAVTVCMTPVVEAPDQPVLTQFDADYYLRRYAAPEQS